MGRMKWFNFYNAADKKNRLFWNCVTYNNFLVDTTYNLLILIVINLQSLPLTYWLTYWMVAVQKSIVWEKLSWVKVLILPAFCILPIWSSKYRLTKKPLSLIRTNKIHYMGALFQKITEGRWRFTSLKADEIL